MLSVSDAPLLVTVRPVAMMPSFSSRLPDAKNRLLSVLMIVPMPDWPVRVPMVPDVPPVMVRLLALWLLIRPLITPLLLRPPMLPLI